MSDPVAASVAAKKEEFARKPGSKKAEKVFKVLSLRGAAKKQASGDAQEKRPFVINVSDAAEAALGSLRSDLAASCKSLGLKSPLLDQFELSLDVEVKTGSAIWALLDSNKFWEQAQTEMLATCRDVVAPIYFERIRKSGTELRGQLNQYANLVHALGTTMPDDMKADLQSDVEDFVAAVDRHVQSMRRGIEFKTGEAVVTFIKKKLKLEKDIVKYRAAKSAIIFIDTGLIAGHIAHMAASFGATAPLAIIACLRLVVEMGQIAEKSARSLETIGKRIETYIEIVSTVWGTKRDEAAKGVKAWGADPEKATNAEKARANIAEGLSGFVSGVTNIDMPSVDTIKKLMNDYQHKLNVLTQTYDALGRELARLQRIMEAYTAILNQFSKRMTPEQKKLVTGMIDNAEAAYSGMYGKALGDGGKSGRIKKAGENIDEWKVSLKALDAVTSKWMAWVSKVTKVVTSAGLGLGNLGGELVTLTNELATQSAELAALVHEHAAEAVISALEDKMLESALEIASTNLKMIGEAVVVMVADAGLVNLAEKFGEVEG